MNVEAGKSGDESAKRGISGWLTLGVGVLALGGALIFAVTRGTIGDEAPASTATAPADSAPTLASLEAKTRAEPDNADAWVQLGLAKFDSNDFAGAVAAYRRASILAPAVANIWSSLGEAIVMAAPTSGPPMPDEALSAFRRAAELDAKDPRARYFLAVKKDLDSDHEGAIAAWLALLADTPSGAPWEADLRRTIEQVGQRHNIEVATRLAAVRQPAAPAPQMPVAAQGIPGPTPDQMREAAALPKGQQDMMVQGMVDGLEARLRDNPQQPDRWIMLMRSRMTLGQAAQAGSALQAAIRANPGEADRLRAEARVLGVPGA